MSSISYVLTVAPVSDLEKSIEWYSAFFGREPDQRPMDGIAEWRMGASSWVQVSTGIEAVGRTAFSVAVDDLDEFRAERVAAGIELSEIVDYGFVRMVDAKDPDGNDVSALVETGVAP